jgi:hypothetical protein
MNVDPAQADGPLHPLRWSTTWYLDHEGNETPQAVTTAAGTARTGFPQKAIPKRVVTDVSGGNCVSWTRSKSSVCITPERPIHSQGTDDFNISQRCASGELDARDCRFHWGDALLQQAEYLVTETAWNVTTNYWVRYSTFHGRALGISESTPAAGPDYLARPARTILWQVRELAAC